jgi:hypothetical protein
MFKILRMCVDLFVGSLKFLAWLFRELWDSSWWIAGESWKAIKLGYRGCRWIWEKIGP